MTQEIQDIKELRAEIDRLTKQLQKMSKDLPSSEMAEDVHHYLDKASEKMKEQLEVSSDYAQKKSRELQDYAKENPWQVAGIAAAAGFIAALAIGGGSKGRK